jgi:hypothetical protein
MASTQVRRPLQSLQTRLEESSAAVAAYRAQEEDETEVRDAIILEAVAAEVPVSLVARWARLSRPRINQIIAEKWPR